MILELEKLILTDEQVTLTQKLVTVLSLSDEKFHCRDVICMGREKLSSIAVAMVCGGVELLSDVESRLAYCSYAPCFDIDPDDRGITIHDKMQELYGWSDFILIKDRWVGLQYLDNRLLLTYREVADIIQAALNGHKKIVI